MGGFLGIGNSSAKTDRGNQLAGINAEWNVYNRGLPIADERLTEGKSTTDSGLDAMGKAKQFWQAVMSGMTPKVPKTEVMASAAPTIDAINEQSDATRVEQANMGTSRGGGVADANQQAQTVRMTETNKAIRDATTNLENRALVGAQGVGEIGGQEADIGMRQISQALVSLGLSKEVADEIVNSSIASRPVSMKANAEVRQQWSNALAALGL